MASGRSSPLWPTKKAFDGDVIDKALAHELGLGAVWLGQILANKDKVNEVLRLNSQHELAALLAFGYPQHRNQQSQRLPLETFILHEFGGTDS